MSRISGKKVKYENIYKVDKNKWSIKVNKGQNSAQSFNLDFEGHKINLKLIYNRLFSKRSSKYHSYSLPFRPDYTLKINLNNNVYFVHFDAKYRSEGTVLDFYEKIGCEKIVPIKDLTDEELEKREENYIEKRDNEEINNKEYVDGDLYKMHTYKDAILKTEGAYVFYPGNKCEIFRVNENEIIPSVGAFPLTPGENGLEEDNLNLFVKGVLRNIIARNDKNIHLY